MTARRAHAARRALAPPIAHQTYVESKRPMSTTRARRLHQLLSTVSTDTPDHAHRQLQHIQRALPRKRAESVARRSVAAAGHRSRPSSPAIGDKSRAPCGPRPSRPGCRPPPASSLARRGREQERANQVAPRSEDECTRLETHPPHLKRQNRRLMLPITMPMISITKFTTVLLVCASYLHVP